MTVNKDFGKKEHERTENLPAGEEVKRPRERGCGVAATVRWGCPKGLEPFMTTFRALYERRYKLFAQF